MDLCNKVIISTPDKWLAQVSIDEKKHPFKSLHFQLHDAGTSKLSMTTLVQTRISDTTRSVQTEFFLVRILPRLDLIRIFTVKIAVFSLNTGKHGPEKNCLLWHFSCSKSIQKKISILRFHQIARANENPLELTIKNKQKETLSFTFLKENT